MAAPPRPRAGRDAYDFSHDLIREVAYLALSPARRRQHHLRVARALERLHADDPGPVSGQLAAHYDRAGAADQAVAWYGRAAATAQQLHAHAEAVRLLDRALDLLRALPETPERRARELALLTRAARAPSRRSDGYPSGRLVEVQRRALALTQALGGEPDPPLLRSLAIASLSRDDFAEARRLAEQLRARGERDADDVLLVEGEYVLGVAAFWQGEFARRAGLPRVGCRALTAPRIAAPTCWRYAQDPKVVCLIRLGCTLWFLGQPEAAIRARDAGLALGEEIGHPFTRMIALMFAALLSLEAREPERLRAVRGDCSPPTVASARLGTTRPSSKSTCGYVDVLDGRAVAGIARIQRAIDETPVAAPTPGHYALLQRVLLEACAAAGEARTGLAAAERLLAMGKGAGLWAGGGPPAARRVPRRARDAGAGGRDRVRPRAPGRARPGGAVARTAGRDEPPPLPDAGAATGRACGAARAQLAALLVGFREGHETPDLREAAALLPTP